MEKNGIKILLILFLFHVLIFSSSMAEDINEKTIFAERLSRTLVKGMNIQGEKISTQESKDLTKLFDSLKAFSNEFPNSQFADDAQYVYIITLFLGSKHEKASQQKMIESMQELVARYPDGRVEELTLQITRDTLNNLDPIFHIPYKFIVQYMKGEMGFWHKDYQTIIENFSAIKDKLEYRDELERLIYLPLVVAYKKQGKLAELKNLVREVREKFPQNKELLFHVENLSGDSQ